MTAPAAVTIAGRALHSGARATVRVTRRAEDDLGLRLLFPGFDTPLAARDLALLTRTARRATVLTHPLSGATIRTPEHLLAAALFFAAEPLDVACDTEEIPGLDGSASPWFDLLAAACATRPETDAAAPSPAPRREAAAVALPPRQILRCREYDCALTWSHRGREGMLQAEPAPRFSVRYTVEHRAFHETFFLARSEDAPAEVLPARTFIFWSDWQTLATQAAATTAGGPAGLLTGVSEDSGLLLAATHEEFHDTRAQAPHLAAPAFPLLHPHVFRMKDEAARHKVLDLLGDLALNGLALPRLRLTVTGGGHALNHLLLDALRAHATQAGTSPEGTSS